MAGEPKIDPRNLPPFRESETWAEVDGVWKRLAGSFREVGFSFEWHDFLAPERFNWAKSFHPASLEICLNLEGHGQVAAGEARAEYEPFSGGFYCQGGLRLAATRNVREKHQFVTLELSARFLLSHLSRHQHSLHPLVRQHLAGVEGCTGIAPTGRLTTRQRETLASLRQPPVFAPAQAVWYESKAIELMSEFLFQTPPDEELFCARQQRVAKERVAKTVAILRENLSEPPTLDDLGRKAGCSSFYLSRTFSKEMGMTIPQFLRQVRMERAAHLLASGKFNVTEAALEVGYSSLSHFSQAFHQAFGCCPGLYPLKTPTQKLPARLGC